MRNACPEHFLAKRKCNHTVCPTRRTFGEKEILSQDDYSLVEAIHHEHPHHRNFIKEHARDIYAKLAPDAEAAAKEFFEVLSEAGITVDPRRLKVVYRRARPKKTEPSPSGRSKNNISRKRARSSPTVLDEDDSDYHQYEDEEDDRDHHYYKHPKRESYSQEEVEEEDKEQEEVVKNVETEDVETKIQEPKTEEVSSPPIHTEDDFSSDDGSFFDDYPNLDAEIYNNLPPIGNVFTL
ncbi:serine acetyltransferase 3, mitochondrial [Acrasis kona]|uniref:Serine acetyltransferase 3, mitochondrial n=1 Tax=Acrasis kona TaxID=1008807 RepID=A0AAW2Z2A5_9EUKA